MEIKIDLDMNQIDYDAINKQIQEKIAELNIKDMYDINAKIDSKISNYIENEIVYYYNKYLARHFGEEGTSPEGRNLIECISKEEIEKRTQKVIDDIFTNDYNEEKLRELMFKVLPDIFSTLLFEKMRCALFSSEHNYRNETYNMVRSQIASEFHRMRY